MTDGLRKKPEWLRAAPLISAVLPETPATQKYRGGTDVDSRYEAAVSDSALDSLARAGVNLVWIHLYNGFGLEFEKAEMERARAVMNSAHAKGMKTAAVVQLGALTPETLLLEESDCQNWLQINSDGQHPVLKSAAFFRSRPCFASEGFMRYMERVCSTAADLGADLIHLENVAYNPEPDACRCAICVASFREFLRQRYGAHDDKTRLAGLSRFGHNTFTHVRPPVFPNHSENIGEQAAKSPHVQEWVEFKTQTLTACLSRMARGIGKRNPECAIGADLLRHFKAGTGGEASIGIQFETQIPLLDVVCGELGSDGGEEHLKIAGLFGVGVPVRARTIADGEPYSCFDLEFTANAGG